MSKGGVAPARWSAPTIVLHWLSAIVIFALVALGFLMTRFFDSATRFDLYQLHKSFGVLALALLAARLLFRFAGAAPAPLGPPWERAAAAIVHGALYALTLLAILLGWLAASSAPLPVPTIVFGLFAWPSLMGADPATFAFASLAHRLTGYGLAMLAGLHAAAALKHALVDREGVFSRMAFGRGPGAPRR